MKFWLLENFQMKNEAEVHFADFRGWRLATDMNNLVHDGKRLHNKGQYFLVLCFIKTHQLSRVAKVPASPLPVI